MTGNIFVDVFVHDRCTSGGAPVPTCTPTTERVSVGPGNAPANGDSYYPAISADGRFVVYVLREGEQQSLWVRQVATGSDVQVLAPDVVAYQGLAISPDGNYVYMSRSARPPSSSVTCA
jgi:Tol biopolymer transport system component